MKREIINGCSELLFKNKLDRISCRDRNGIVNRIKSKYNKLVQKECKIRHEWVGTEI